MGGCGEILTRPRSQLVCTRFVRILHRVSEEVHPHCAGPGSHALLDRHGGFLAPEKANGCLCRCGRYVGTYCFARRFIGATGASGVDAEVADALPARRTDGAEPLDRNEIERDARVEFVTSTAPGGGAGGPVVTVLPLSGRAVCSGVENPFVVRSADGGAGVRFDSIQRAQDRIYGPKQTMGLFYGSFGRGESQVTQRAAVDHHAARPARSVAADGRTRLRLSDTFRGPAAGPHPPVLQEKLRRR